MEQNLLQFPNYATNSPDNPIKVVAYCRVSTDQDDQISSFNNQKQYYTELLTKYTNVEFIDLYGDEGISGVNTTKRIEFNRMMSDAEDNKFDLIFTKEVSRFARNTIDTLRYTRRLKELNVGVYFETDNIFTLDNDGELRLTIMATLAQEESRKISVRVKWGLQRAMKNGVVLGLDKLLGYDIKDGKISVNEEEAKYIKLIYQWYLDGHGCSIIVRKLKEEGLLKGKTGGNLTHTTIRNILKNEKYSGDLVQHKNITVDFLTKKAKPNKDKDSFIIIRDHHQAIIDRKLWNAVQLKINNNLLKYNCISHNARYIWSGKIFCENCGTVCRRTSFKLDNGKRYYTWKCSKTMKGGIKECPNGKYLREDHLENIFMTVLDKIINDDEKEEVLQNLVSILRKNIKDSDVSNEINTIKKQLSQIQTKKNKLLDLYIDDNSSLTKENYNMKNEEYINLEKDLTFALDRLENESDIVEGKIDKLEKLYNIIKEKIESPYLNEYMVKEFLEKITISKDKVVKIYLINGNYEIDMTDKRNKIVLYGYTTDDICPHHSAVSRITSSSR